MSQLPVTIQKAGKDEFLVRYNTWDGWTRRTVVHEEFMPRIQYRVLDDGEVAPLAGHKRHIATFDRDGRLAGVLSPSLSFFSELAKRVRFAPLKESVA